MRFQAQRGTEDVLPGESYKWATLESIFRDHTRLYGYGEIRTPTFEDTEVFTRTAGDTSDIVTKQMYTFLDKGDRSITLKPEGTAPVIRAAIQGGLLQAGVTTRLSYVTPIFRYERPQKGRLREAHQLGLELIGSSSPAADAEVIEVTYRFYQKIGLTSVEVLLNSLGRAECRARFREALLAHAQPYLKSQDDEARSKIERNPLRLLDSKDKDAAETVATAPSILDFLEEDSKRRFEVVQQMLSDSGIAYVIRPDIVRGLDYYNETVFEIQSAKLGSQSSLCGGGRYDNLIRDLGGPAMPSVGVGMGIERALIVLEEEKIPLAEPIMDAFVAFAGIEGQKVGNQAARVLREAGLSVVVDPDEKSLKSQLRQADRLKVRKVLIFGDDEIAKLVATVKDLGTGEQIEVGMSDIVSAVRESS